ncbi:MAG: sodium:solute symporter [Candidatus Altiarchaeota archaeon]|nr:sodium:solute symporter [Candidatus Altiarchaeota archaeon]
MHWIMAAVVGFFAIIILVGLYLSKSVKGRSENYIVADRKLILGVTAATLTAQSIDADITLGLTNFTFQYGFWSGAAMILGLGGALILIGLFFAEPLNKMKLLTLPDFYRKTYGRHMEAMVSMLMALSASIFIGGCLVALGFIFQSFLGIPYWPAIILVSAGILTYTMAGGLVSISKTDIIQLVFVLLGAAALMFIVLDYGLLSNITQGIENPSKMLDSNTGPAVNIAILLALGLGNIVAIDFMERVFATDKPETSKKACYIAGIGTILIGIPFILVGVSSNSLFTELDIPVNPDAEPVLLTFLSNVQPQILTYLILLGLIAAAVSTADGLILAASSITSHNLLGYKPGSLNKRGDRLLYMSRLCMIPVLAFSIVCAITLPFPGTLIILSFDILLSGAAIPFILGVHWKKANKPAAIASFVAGVLTRLLLFVLTPTFYGIENNILFIEGFLTPAFDGVPTILSPLIGLVVFVAVASITQENNIKTG